MRKGTIVVLIILALVVAYLGYASGRKIFPFGKERYQAVQLTSGEVYFGHLSFVPRLKLSHVAFVQSRRITKNATSTPQTQLVPLSSLYFAPENEMYLEKDQILWWANLQPGSQIAKLLRKMK